MSANNTSTASCSGSDDVNMTSRCGKGCSTSVLVSVNYDQPELSVVALALLLVIVGTMLCNLLVGVALIRFRTLRNVSNLLIGNLALSDFLLSVTVLPLSAVNECLGHWVFGRRACSAWLIVDVFFCTASIWNLCLIAFDRFTATFFPLWYRGEGRANWHHAFAYAAIVWIVAAAACLPPLVNWNDLPVNYVTHRVESSAVTEPCLVYRCVLFRSPNYVLYSASVSFFVPCLVTLVLYISILAELRRRRSKAEALKRRRSSDQHQLQPQRQAAVVDESPGPTPAAGGSHQWNQRRDYLTTTPLVDERRPTASTSAAVSWLEDRDNDEVVFAPSVENVDADQPASDDSPPTSPSRLLSQPPHNGLNASAPDDADNDDDDVTRYASDITHDDDDVIRTCDVIQQQQSSSNELTPRRGLLPMSNSEMVIPSGAGVDCSAAETFIHRFSCSTLR